MSIARYTLICSSKSAHREVRHSTNKRLIDCLGLHLESLSFIFYLQKRPGNQTLPEHAN